MGFCMYLQTNQINLFFRCDGFRPIPECAAIRPNCDGKLGLVLNLAPLRMARGAQIGFGFKRQLWGLAPDAANSVAWAVIPFNGVGHCRVIVTRAPRARTIQILYLRPAQK